MVARKVVAAGCLVGVALAGCGGASKPSDQEQVAGVVRSFLQSLSAGDGTKACSLLTADAQRALVAEVTRRARAVGVAPGSCEEAVGLVRAAVPQATLAAIRDARVERVAVKDGQATGRVVDGTSFAPQRVTLVRSGGSWRIAGVPTLIGS